MEYINTFFTNFWQMTLLMHLYIIGGLLAAGIIKEFISDDFVKRQLGGKGAGSALKAALIGLPLPLCSCSVIPLAASLRKSGAGRGAVASFLISTPMTGVDSVIATYGVFGWVITLFRVASASLAAILAGIFTDRLTADTAPVPEAGGCGCSGGCCSSSSGEKPAFRQRLKNIMSYSYFELLDDLAYPLLSGLVMAAVITIFITPELTGSRVGAFAGYMIAFLAGIPLYVCSISAIPVALSLIVAGFTPGAAFIFLAGAPATNIVTVSVVRQMLGKGGTVAYLLSIISVTLGFALLTDYLFSSGAGFGAFAGESESFGLAGQISAGVFLAVISYKTVRQKFFR